MKDGAILSNTGHFNVEIEIPALRKLSTEQRNAREFVEEFTMSDGRRLYLVADGRLVNLAAAEGHPALVMDMSFANQALGLEYAVAHAGDAKVVGVYAYNPAGKQTSGADRERFARNEDFAAVVDWSGLPDNITVEAVWFDSFENIVGSVGPGTPSRLRDQTIVTAEAPKGLKYHLPGQYIFAIERLDNGGRPVEVIGRRVVYVER